MFIKISENPSTQIIFHIYPSELYESVYISFSCLFDELKNVLQLLYKVSVKDVWSEWKLKLFDNIV